MKFLFPLLGIVLCTPVFADIEKEQEMAVRRVQAHLLLKDPISAVDEAKKQLEKYPESKALQAALIRALCEKGEEVEAIEELKKIIDANKEEIHNRKLLEVIAWGVLSKGRDSSQLVIRISSLLGAAFTNDAKAIPLILEQLQGPNALLRSLSVRLSASYGDAPLKKELARLLKQEKIWYVRMEVLRAIGALHMTSLIPDLKEIIGNPKTLAEEKANAIISLVSMLERIDTNELKSLVKSDRAGLRQLASEIVTHLDLQENVNDIIPLLKDSSPYVRTSALTTVGLLKVKQYKDKSFLDLITPLLDDPAPEVAITAAWAATINGEKIGAKKLRSYLSNPYPEWRRLASAAIAVTGKHGVDIASSEIKKTLDPYVKVNLAIGLIGQRENITLACDTLYQVLSQEKDLWMWDNSYHPLFRSLAPSGLRHIDQIPNYPHVVDQLVRLDLLSYLSIMRYPKAQEAVKSYLQSQSWGAVTAAAATLLEEGDEEALSIVRNLLDDPEEKIRVQAAFILAILGSDEAALKVLQDSYPHLDREMKVHILEAIGHIGDTKSIPFLLEILEEPFQVLRVVAASALIQCLYH